MPKHWGADFNLCFLVHLFWIWVLTELTHVSLLVWLPEVQFHTCIEFLAFWLHGTVGCSNLLTSRICVVKWCHDRVVPQIPISKNPAAYSICIWSFPLMFLLKFPSFCHCLWSHLSLYFWRLSLSVMHNQPVRPSLSRRLGHHHLLKHRLTW